MSFIKLISSAGISGTLNIEFPTFQIHLRPETGEPSCPNCVEDQFYYFYWFSVYDSIKNLLQDKMIQRIWKKRAAPGKIQIEHARGYSVSERISRMWVWEWQFLRYQAKNSRMNNIWTLSYNINQIPLDYRLRLRRVGIISVSETKTTTGLSFPDAIKLREIFHTTQQLLCQIQCIENCFLRIYHG